MFKRLEWGALTSYNRKANSVEYTLNLSLIKSTGRILA